MASSVMWQSIHVSHGYSPTSIWYMEKLTSPPSQSHCWTSKLLWICENSSSRLIPLDPRQQFCQFWPWECNFKAVFWLCWVLATSNQPIRELDPIAGAYQIFRLWVCCSWHPYISQSESCCHYPSIRFWICWILAPSNQPIIERRLPSTNQMLDPLDLSTSMGLEANPTSQTVKIPLPFI